MVDRGSRISGRGSRIGSECRRESNSDRYEQLRESNWERKSGANAVECEISSEGTEPDCVVIPFYLAVVMYISMHSSVLSIAYMHMS